MSGNGMKNIKFAENDRLLCRGSKKSGQLKKKYLSRIKKMTPAPKTKQNIQNNGRKCSW
jgi:hypothetical protein